MQLSDRTGISCDFCGIQHRTEFVYYSIDMRDAKSQYGSPLPLDNVRRLKIAFSFDLCNSCYECLANLVVQNYQPVSIGMICDLTGATLNGEFTYTYVDIIRVMVKILPTGMANIITEPRELELTISSTACTDLINRVMQCRKIATGWSSNTGE